MDEGTKNELKFSRHFSYKQEINLRALSIFPTFKKVNIYQRFAFSGTPESRCVPFNLSMKQLQGHGPPKWADRFLCRFCRPDLLEGIQGDLQEIFADNAEQYSLRRARRMYAWQVLGLCRPGIIRRMGFVDANTVPAAMFKNYLKVTIRSFHKNRGYASLNTLGLSLGFAAFILLSIYFYHETNYEDFHGNADRIYRTTWNMRTPSGHTGWARLHHNFINRLPEEMPEVEHLVRFQNQERKYVKIGTEKFRPPHAYLADREVFEVFDFDLLQGDPAGALAEPHSIVITEKLAQTYFGEAPALGQEILVTGTWNAEEIPHKITGIMRDLPSHTHLPVDALFSFASEEERTGWAYVYLLLREGAEIASVREKMSDFVVENIGEDRAANNEFEFQSLRDIHLHSNLSREIKPNGNSMYAKAALYVAIFILVIAMINFINLSSALSVGRAKEMGVRKIMGAGRSQNLFYALTESVAYNVLALLLGALLAFLAYPYFQSITGTDFRLDPWIFGAVLAGVAIVCGLLSGWYPGVVLNAVGLLHATKSGADVVAQHNGKTVSMRRVFIGIQLVVSITLIATTLVTYRQFNFIKNKSLGLKKEQMLAIPGVAQSVTDKYPIFKERLLPLTGVAEVGACMQVPSEAIKDGGFVSREGQSDEEQLPLMDLQPIDHDFIKLLEIELIAGEIQESQFRFGQPSSPEGRLAPQDLINGRTRSYLINETAMKQLGYSAPEEVIGEQISWTNNYYTLQNGPVTGVVRDFHQENFKARIDPVVLTFEPNWLRTFLISIRTEDVPATVREIQSAWDQLFPKYPFEYSFLDEMYDKLYQGERTQLQLLLISSGLALVLALLGLFSLIAFTLKTRMREIAIRKVLGANLGALVRLIGNEYLRLVLLSSCIAIPVSLWWVWRWLENFAYRIAVSPFTYFFAIGLVALLLFGTISLQTFFGTRINPAQKLRGN